MECDEVRLRLVRYLDNDLPGRVRRDVEEHLEHCYLCQEELNEIVAVLDVCRDALQHPCPRNRFEELHPQLYPPVATHAPSAYAPRRRGRGVLWALAAAAGILILINVGGSVIDMAGQLDSLFNYAAATSERGEVVEPEAADMPVLLAWQHRILWARSLSDDIGRAEDRAPVAAEKDPQAGNGDSAYTPVSWRPEVGARWWKV